MDKKRTEEMTQIERLFEMFANAAANPKPYTATKLPVTVTVTIRPECMEILHVLACRIGTTRAGVARHILELGCVEAAFGAGFTVDEDLQIPKTEKGNWDLAARKYGFSFITDEKEEN